MCTDDTEKSRWFKKKWFKETVFPICCLLNAPLKIEWGVCFVFIITILMVIPDSLTRCTEVCDLFVNFPVFWRVVVPVSTSGNCSVA